MGNVPRERYNEPRKASRAAITGSIAGNLIASKDLGKEK
jgi:hypothetical protein